MTDTYFGFRFLLLFVLIAINGFFAGAEVSLVSVRTSRLHQLAEQGQAGAQAALSLLARPERLLSVIQIGVTLASLGLGWAGEGALYEAMITVLRPVVSPGWDKVLHGAAFALAFLVISYLHVVLGEVVPKNVAFEKADRLAVAVAPVLLVFYRLASVFVVGIEKSSAAISRILGLQGEQRGGGHSSEELKLIVTSSRGMGYLPAFEEDMIHGVLDLSNLAVREIMVPRNDIVSIPLDASLDQVLEVMIEQRHSRLPVYENKREQIVGILYYKDLLPVWQERRASIRAGRPSRPFRISRLMRKYLVVPETKPLAQMLEEFKQGRSHMALVVDEWGTIVGLVTVEDVLEQIVGPIRDEYDETAPPRSLEASQVDFDGATRIRDLEAEYGIEIPTDAGFDTLAGFLLYKLGYIPRAGEFIEYEGRRFTVLEMERNRIAKVRVEKVPQQAIEPAG